MVNHHRISFFGSKTGILFDSGPSSNPTIFLTFIKKRGDGSWGEKVIASTEAKKPEYFSEFRKVEEESSEEKVEEKIESVVIETAVLAGTCEGETEKALLIAFDGRKEIWVPKSTIRSDYDSRSKTTQKFEVDTWILKKNNIM